jgi:hypothetical protein
VDDRALHADAAAVDHAHLAQTGFVRGGEVLLDDEGDVARGEGVEVERVVDGYAVRGHPG